MDVDGDCSGGQPDQSTFDKFGRQAAVRFAGHDLILLPDFCVWWPEERSLLVADLHLGKDTSFRSHGIAIPSGPTTSTLNRLSLLAQNFQAERIIILGDFVHAVSSVDSQLTSQLEKFHKTHADVEVWLVLGNHDRSHANWPASWPLKIFQNPVKYQGIWLAHAIEDLADEETSGNTESTDIVYSMVGHVHPAIRFGIGNRGRETRKCYWLHINCLTLPSFGSFTGSYVVTPEREDRCWVADGDSVVEISQELRKGRVVSRRV